MIARTIFIIIFCILFLAPVGMFSFFVAGRADEPRYKRFIPILVYCAAESWRWIGNTLYYVQEKEDKKQPPGAAPSHIWFWPVWLLWPIFTFLEVIIRWFGTFHDAWHHVHQWVAAIVFKVAGIKDGVKDWKTRWNAWRTPLWQVSEVERTKLLREQQNASFRANHPEWDIPPLATAGIPVVPQDEE